MGSYSYFIGCPSREAAERYDLKDIFASASKGRELEAKYYIPLFWLAAFGEDAFIVIHKPDNERFTVLYVEAADGIARLRRRREAVLALVGERFGPLYDAWIEHVTASYPAGLLVRTEDLFAMNTFKHGDEKLRASLNAFGPIDRGEPLVDREIQKGFAGSIDALEHIGQEEDPVDGATRHRAILAGWSVGTGWPPPPTPEELSRWDPSGRAGRRLSLSNLTASELEGRFMEQLASAVRAVWAAAVPAITLQALWARCDFAQTYAIARALPSSTRATTLAWYSRLDPEPTSARAARAAEEALRVAAGTFELFEVVATVPLDHLGVAPLADRLAKHETKTVLDLRLDRGEPKLDKSTGWDRDGVLWALAAEQAARHGRRDEAVQALASVLDVNFDTAPMAQATIPTFQRLSAWDTVPVAGFPEAAIHAAAFVAGRDGEEAVGALLERMEPARRVLALPAAMLGAGGAPAAWRAELAPYDEARVLELYQEGLLSPAERFALEMGRAACGPTPREAVFARVLASLADAHAEARAFVDGVVERWAGPRRDEKLVARRSAQLRAFMLEAKSAGAPTGSMLSKLAGLCRRLADAGGVAEVREAIDALEQIWGPAASFPKGSVVRTVEILSCAAGRALEAAQLDEEELRAEASVWVFVVAALERDGHHEEARAGLSGVLAEVLDPADLARLAPAALALDPAGEGRMREALEGVLAALPRTSDAAALWLGEVASGSADR